MSRSDLTVTPWSARFRGRRLPCAIGRGGITPTKREGDMATPTGPLRLTGVWYRPDRILPPLTSARPIGPRDLWCDDPDHPLYNLHARAPLSASHEIMRRADPLYDLIITTDWNWPDPTPGQGSAIFLHSWRRPRFPTAGCIAFKLSDLIWVLQRWKPESRIISRP